MLKEWRLATSLLVRECRAGQWLIVFFALILAVTMITAIDFFTNRLTHGLNDQSAQLLGGDLVVRSTTPIPEEWSRKARDYSLRTAEVLVIPTVISANNELQLVNLEAVSNDYPLFGNALHLQHNTVFTEYRLLSMLSVQPGKNISIGAANFKIQDILPGDIDMMNVGWIIAPKVLMRLDDVNATKIILPGSRVDYRLLLAGDKKNIQSFRTWITPQLKTNQGLVDALSQRNLLVNSLQHADKYIQLVILFCLLMCGTAITLSVRQHLQRHFEDVALWRCLGAPQKQVTGIYFKQLLTVAVGAGLIGTIAGYILQMFFEEIFRFYIQFPLPNPDFSPILIGFLTSTLLLFCYAYPVITVLPRTSPLYLWRNETAAISRQQNAYAIITLILLLLYVYWIMDFSLTALFILDSLLLSIGFLYVLYILSLSFIKKLVKISRGAVRRGLSQFIQQPETAGIQLTAFTLIAMSLFVLGSVKNDLLGNWETTLPANTPNYFAFNIASYEMENVARFFQSAQIPIDDIYPMVRGRLTTLNGKPIFAAIPESAREHNALHRDLNISSMLKYPSDNKIESGPAWSETDKGKLLISVEKNLAADLHLKLGDKLGFQIGDSQITAVISNIRSVDWGSFHPNFYIIFPPGALDAFPSTYITSFHLQPQQTTILNQLVHDFPNVTVIDIASVLQQIQHILTKTAAALQYLFLFAIVAALLIFIANLLASMDERREAYRLMRVLGASKKYIISSLAVEFSFLATLTLIFSFMLAKVISYLLVTMLF